MCRHNNNMVDQHRPGVRETDRGSHRRNTEGRRGKDRGRGREGGRERVLLRLFLSFRRVQRL